MNEAKRREVARILRTLAARVREGEYSGTLLDSNGVTCGHFQTYKGEFRLELRTVNSAFRD